MNPENLGDETLETFQSLVADTVPGVSQTAELGAAGFIFREFRGIFKANGIEDFGVVEESLIACLMKASQIKSHNNNIERVELYAKVLQDNHVLADDNFLPGTIFFEIYLTQKTSNGVCEGFGKIGNLIREGVRGSMGLLYLEANLRLHFVPPLEKGKAFFEYVRKLWILCLGQSSIATDERSKKRKKRSETVDPQGNEVVRSRSSKALAKKRRLASRLTPLFNIKN